MKRTADTYVYCPTEHTHPPGLWMSRIPSSGACLPSDFPALAEVLHKDRLSRRSIETAMGAFPNRVTLLRGTTGMFYRIYQILENLLT